MAFTAQVIVHFIWQLSKNRLVSMKQRCQKSIHIFLDLYTATAIEMMVMPTPGILARLRPNCCREGTLFLHLAL